MQLSIDERQCSKYHLSPQQLLVALAVRSTEDFKALWKDLLQREVIVKHDGQWMITQRWNDKVDDILMESTGKTESEDRLTELAKKMRKEYPDGKIPGTSYYYRCNVGEVASKLKRFFLKYGNYSDDEIIAATRRFVKDKKGDTYLPLLKYFIWKQKTVRDEWGVGHVEEVSTLATYLENSQQEGEKEGKATNDNSWLFASRN
jgi:hypothetical protein